MAQHANENNVTPALETRLEARLKILLAERTRADLAIAEHEKILQSHFETRLLIRGAIIVLQELIQEANDEPSEVDVLPGH